MITLAGRASRSRMLAVVASSLVLGSVILTSLAGCSATGSSPSVSSTTIAQPAYPQFRTYSGVRIQQDVRYRTVDDDAIRLNVCQPRKSSDYARAAIIVVHGGSWRGGDKSSPEWSSVCQWLASAGFVAFSLDYRLAPEYTFPDGLRDVQAAVTWARRTATVEKYDIDPDRIGAFGGSAGGNLVSMLGTVGYGSRTLGTRVAAVAELSGPANLTSRGQEQSNFLPVQLAYLGCTSLSDCPAARKASPIYQVDVTDPPFFVGHSLSERIPLSQSESFVTELRKHGVPTTFVTVKGSLHSIAMLGSNMRARIIAFFHETLDPLP